MSENVRVQEGAGVALTSELGFPGYRRARRIRRACMPSHAAGGLTLTEISVHLWCVRSLGISGPECSLHLPAWVPLYNDRGVELPLASLQ